MDKKVQYEKKKINVPLLIVLLFCAFVPGIIYLIWCLIPRKVVLNVPEPKTTGWVVRLIGSAISVVNWIYMIIHIYIIEDGEIVIAFCFGIVIALIALIFSILSKKASKRSLLVLTVLAAVSMLIFDLIQLFYGWVSLIGVIVLFVGCSLGFKYNNYIISKEKSASIEQPVEE